MSLVRTLFGHAFGGPLPPRLERLIPWPLAEQERLAFKACPILVLRGEGPPRGYVADVAEPQPFVERVAAELGPAAAAFLRRAPPGVRRMVDTDGEGATLYLDDLQGDDRAGDALMCTTWRWPDGAATTVRQHGTPPRHLLPPPWQRHVDDAHHAGLAGIWCTRRAGDALVSLLWVNDARWRGDPEVSARAVDTLADRRWAACRGAAAREGLVAYPDSVEIRADGAWEVTLGVAPSAR